MDIVLDTSSIINLINGSVLDRILAIPNYRFFIGEHLLDKEVLNDVQKIIIEALISKNKIEVLSLGVTLSVILVLQNKFRLGLGETECIALCKISRKAICTDDLRARKLASIEIGDLSVLGSLGLLKESVKQGTLDCREVLESYQLMLEKGGFLPRNLSSDYFCKNFS